MSRMTSRLAIHAVTLSLAAAAGACIVEVKDGGNSADSGSSSTSGGNSTSSSSGGGSVDGRLVWVLIHPSDAPNGPGIFLFDEDQQQVLSHLDLPPAVESPHALAYDGKSLWLGEMGFSGAIYQIDPATGSVLSTLPDIRTEGIAVDGDTLWYSGQTPTLQMNLVHIDLNGALLGSVPVSPVVIQDLAFDGGSLYYLINDDIDRIVRVDPASGAESPVADHVYVAPYALSFDGEHLAMAADGKIRRFDPATGVLVSEGPFNVPGWISAIAFAGSAP